MIKIFGLVVLLGLFSGFCGKMPAKTDEKQPPPTMEQQPSITTGDSIARYGEKIRFAPNYTIFFKNFGLTYLGERRVTSDKFPRGFLFHDFKIEAGSERQTVSWSSGTGDIAPAAFQIAGQNYELELRMSDKLGKLAENELVIWEK